MCYFKFCSHCTLEPSITFFTHLKSTVCKTHWVLNFCKLVFGLFIFQLVTYLLEGWGTLLEVPFALPPCLANPETFFLYWTYGGREGKRVNFSKRLIMMIVITTTVPKYPRWCLLLEYNFGWVSCRVQVEAHCGLFCLLVVSKSTQICYIFLHLAWLSSLWHMFTWCWGSGLGVSFVQSRVR